MFNPERTLVTDKRKQFHSSILVSQWVLQLFTGGQMTLAYRSVGDLGSCTAKKPTLTWLTAHHQHHQHGESYITEVSCSPAVTFHLQCSEEGPCESCSSLCEHLFFSVEYFNMEETLYSSYGVRAVDTAPEKDLQAEVLLRPSACFLASTPEWRLVFPCCQVMRHCFSCTMVAFPCFWWWSVVKCSEGTLQPKGGT